MGLFGLLGEPVRWASVKKCLSSNVGEGECMQIVANYLRFGHFWR
jgi:hypothetical protein